MPPCIAGRIHRAPLLVGDNLIPSSAWSELNCERSFPMTYFFKKPGNLHVEH